MIDMRQIEQDLIWFIQTNSPTEDALTAGTDLLQSGILDSLMVVDLACHVESTYGTQLNETEIAPRHFQSVACLARLVASKLAGPDDAPVPLCAETWQP